MEQQPGAPALRIAAWNLERPSPRRWKKAPAQRARMEEVDADLWVLTETRAGYSPGEGYQGVESPPHHRRRDDEAGAAVWSRWPVTPTAVEPNARGTVSATVDTPIGPLIVCGIIETLVGRAMPWTIALTGPA